MTRLSSMTSGFAGFVAVGRSAGPTITVPGAPTIGTATAATATSVTVSFTAPLSDGGSAITSYTAVSSPGSITGSVSQSGSGSITVTGLTAGTAYTFVVYATNSIGNSPNSSSSNSITPNYPTVGYAADMNTSTTIQAVSSLFASGSAFNSSGNLISSTYYFAGATMFVSNFDTSNTMIETNKITTPGGYYGGQGYLTTDSGGNIYLPVQQGPNSARYCTTLVKMYANTQTHWQQNVAYNLTTYATSPGKVSVDTTNGYVYFPLHCSAGTNSPSAIVRYYIGNGAVTGTGASTYEKTYSSASATVTLNASTVDSTGYVTLFGSATYSAYTSLYMRRLSPTGTSAWAFERYLSTSAGRGDGMDVTTDPSNNIYFVGWSGNPTNSAFAYSVTSGGTLRWAVQFSSDFAYGFGICYANGNLYVSGRTSTPVACIVQLNPATGAVVAGLTFADGNSQFDTIYYNSTTGKLTVTSVKKTYIIPADFSTIKLPQTVGLGTNVTVSAFSPTTSTILFNSSRTATITEANVTTLTTAAGTMTTTRTANPSYSIPYYANVLGN